ncbi:Stomatin-like protein 1 like protein [Argiope bruennichi]|uniref:Stomatin-like protein 1 like protein n=2 Tax=Argiope bruennichi TaxID=94029 RepID=A0A8T0E111_ARGBR|nr:Stomatin-like protein 1 like protein [Argiope bruennichi]
MKEPLSSAVLRSIIVFFLYLLALISFPFSLWICIKRISSLERIVLMRLGKLQPIKGPGFAFILPCVDKWTKVDLRPQSFDVSTSQLLTADGGIVEVQSDIEFRVSDVTSYVLKLHHHENTLKELGLLCLKNIISEEDLEDLETKRDLICCKIKDELNRSVINWGLEVVHVYLHSVKVLKAAEPVDAIGTLMTALKAATGNSSEHTAAMFPLIPELAEKNSGQEINKNEQNVTKTQLQPEYCVTAIKTLAALAEKEGYVKDLSAKFRFDIVGRSTSRLLISFDKGHISVFENVESSKQSDVQLMLTEDNLRDFLNGEVSPLEAYMDGKVMVTGDWSLLRSLAKVFDLCRPKSQST